MSYVDPKIRNQFESLPIELKNEILSRNLNLRSMSDLIRALEDIEKG